MEYNVFISWSKPRSYQVAKALHDWLPNVIQSAKPWISSENVDKGTLWSSEIAAVLSTVRVGIVCVTPENVAEPWLNFEAGALSKTVEESRVCTFLFGGISSGAVPPPLGRFNHTQSEEPDTRRLLHTIRRALNLELTESQLDKAFEKMWPDLDAELQKISTAEQEVLPRRRSVEDMVGELLDIARSDARRRSELDPLKELLDDLMPFLRQAVALAKGSAGVRADLTVSRAPTSSLDERPEHESSGT